MTALVLDGCRTTPLAGYLASLGLLRAVSRLTDRAAAGHWSQGRFVLRSKHSTVDELAASLCGSFEPEAVVSPWNAGSGFAGNGKSVAAEKALMWARESTDPRVSRLRSAVLAADQVVEVGRRRGWGRGDELWDKARKKDVLRLCRNELPDDALAWLDAVVALGQDDDPSFARLLGTGGNLGRQDLSSSYLQRCRSVLEDSRSREWLLAAVDGRTSVPLPRETLGQYDPGGVGNPEDADAVGNPWTFVLLIEGALLFATAVVRRHGADYGRAALPFQVRGSTAGFDSAAVGERALAELWAPEWSNPATSADVAHLLGEGRADWNARPARSGLDFARALATLGVDRGIEAFQRHVFVDRLGQSPLAVPGGRVLVGQRGGVGLLAPLDRWLDAVRRSNPPAAVAARVRGIEQALFVHAGSGAAADLVEVFAALGRCHEAVSRSGAVRAATTPLVLPRGRELLVPLWRAAHHDTELRIALALATAHDASGSPTLGGLRTLLSPVGGRGGYLRWTEDAATAPLGSGLFAALGEAARRRGFPGATTDSGQPAVRGARLSFTAGLELRGGDLNRLVGAEIDEQRIVDLLAGLLTTDWQGIRNRPLPGAGKALSDPGIDPLLPFTGTDALPVPQVDGSDRPITLRPAHHWPALLNAGRGTQVLREAAHRLRIAGIRHVVTPAHSPHDSTRLAALLLVRTTLADRLAALRRVAVIPAHRTTVTHNQESTA